MKPNDIKTFDDLKEAFVEKVERDNLRDVEMQKTLDSYNKLMARQHEEVMVMLRPLYQAFTFSKDVDRAKTDFIIKYSKYIGFVLKVAALAAIVWAAFKFGVTQIKQ